MRVLQHADQLVIAVTLPEGPSFPPTDTQDVGDAARRGGIAARASSRS